MACNDSLMGNNEAPWSLGQAVDPLHVGHLINTGSDGF